ncbi:nucleotide exchange factor GrpE [Nostoc sp. FACHB-190]|uniref:nucleotide exchange factor GrpE n=1 Tax=Nostoc sp. FACHB-190 TaxID=2692838 RepID=UPI001689EA2C|nr:nucleotide exchange factor GrpE [Nostoc sp. FACHB-190]MBD2300971.1 nucleotide exchange factor GrpE [Nostoc sp. FACHB-190]
MTNDTEALFAQFLDYLQSEPGSPDYLGEPPESTYAFDPYQMVAEWTALRHEIKQQGKLLRSTQETLQQALEVNRTNQEQLQTSLEASQKQKLAQVEQQQEKLLKELLGIMDALDQACAYWQQELEVLSITSNSKPAVKKSFWDKLGELFSSQKTQDELSEKIQISEPLTEMLTSNQQGVELIRRSLLEILRQRRVVPIIAEGKLFDSQIMYAVGRQVKTDVAENTVIQEVVKGYLWGDKILREAQVIVATQVIQKA